MSFWKDVTPGINSIIKNDQDVIEIEHSHGVFNMNTAEVREIKLTNDYYSAPVNKNYSLRFSAFFAFFMTGASQNLISQIMVKIYGSGETIFSLFIGNILKNSSWTLGIFLFIIFLQFLGWFALFYKWKITNAMINWFLEKKQDVIVISTNAKEFKFRLLDDKLPVPLLESAKKTQNAESGVKWRIILLVFCMIILVITHLDIPYWFDMLLNDTKNIKLVNILGLNIDQEYLNYRDSDVGIIRLLFDGFLSNLTLFVGFVLFVIVFFICSVIATLAFIPFLIQILISFLSVYYMVSYPFFYFQFGQKQPIKNIFKLTLELCKLLLGLWAMLIFGILNLGTFGILEKSLSKLFDILSMEKSLENSLENSIKLVSADSSNGDDLMLEVFLVTFILFIILILLIGSIGYTEFIGELVYIPINNLIEPLKQAVSIFNLSLIQFDTMAFIFLVSLVPYFILFLIIFLLLANRNNKNRDSKA
jgi:hypothetical protein